jgi:hypothetical protein
MASGEEADQKLLDHLLLADDHPAELGEDRVVGGVQPLDGRGLGHGWLQGSGGGSGLGIGWRRCGWPAQRW